MENVAYAYLFINAAFHLLLFCWTAIDKAAGTCKIPVLHGVLAIIAFIPVLVTYGSLAVRVIDIMEWRDWVIFALLIIGSCCTTTGCKYKG